jgi:hypothetical protein
MFDTAAYKELFESQVETKHPWVVGVTEDSVSRPLGVMGMLTMQLVQTIMSKSYLTEQNLKGQERVDFEKQLRDIIQNVDKTWIDEKVTSPILTLLTCRTVCSSTATTRTSLYVRGKHS